MPSANPELEAYLTIVSTFGLGIVRLNEARITFNTAIISILQYRFTSPVETKDNPYHALIEAVRSISFAELDSFKYVGWISHLVYATTLFETFLADTTLFLLIKFPGAMGRGHSITVDALMQAKSRSDLIVQAAQKKVRELSYLPYLGWIQDLRDRFGLQIAIDDTTTQFLEHYSTRRNVIVHDQGIFRIHPTDEGTVTVSPKTCARHPTPVTMEDVEKAITAYRSAAIATATAVAQGVFKADPSVFSHFERLPRG